MWPGVMFNRQWWKTTLLVLIAVGVMVRLGIWQLDRLSQRRAFNSMVVTNQSQPILDLEEPGFSGADLTETEYRSIRVSGVYDHRHQIALRNQVYQDRLGVHLLTPLHISGKDQIVLVDRGWVPFEDFTNHRLDQYDEPGLVEVIGVIRLPDRREEKSQKQDRSRNPVSESLTAMRFVNLDEIEDLLGSELISIYIQQAPDSSWNRMPVRILPELDLTEGPHLGYAIQWFIFAGLLGLGYPFYLRREITREKPGEQDSEGAYLSQVRSEESTVRKSRKEQSVR